MTEQVERRAIRDKVARLIMLDHLQLLSDFDVDGDIYRKDPECAASAYSTADAIIAALTMTPQEADYDDIPDTPEQRALIKKHNDEVRRQHPNLKSIYHTPTSMVEVCHICDIAGCRHIREKNAASDTVTPQEAAKVLLDAMGPKDLISEDVMELFWEGSPFTALRAISEDSQ